MDLPISLALPIFWLVFRLILVVPLAYWGSRFDDFSRSPFGPSGRMGDDSSCLTSLITALISGGVAAYFAGSFLMDQANAAGNFISDIQIAIAGIVGFVLGVVIDGNLTSVVQPWLSRSLIFGRLPEVRGWLVDGTDQDQMRAAVILGHMQTEPVAAEYLPELLGVLRSSNPDVRYFAACAILAIVQTTDQAPAEVGIKLLPLLSDPEPKVRAPVGRTLVEIGQADRAFIVRPLASALISDDVTVWGLVTWYLDAPGRFTHLALPEIFEAVEKHGEQLVSTLHLVFRWIDPVAKSKLLEALAHPNPGVRELARRALARIELRQPG